MLRFRRYRVFLVLAAIAVLLIVRFTHSRNILNSLQIERLDLSPSSNQDQKGRITSPLVKATSVAESKARAQDATSAQYGQGQAASTPTPAPTSSSSRVKELPTEVAEKSQSVNPASQAILPDRVPISPSKATIDEDEAQSDLHPIAPPGRVDLPTFPAVPTTIHWEKQVENFPVPTASIIQLPTGKPLSIPKIQHAFNDETTDAKINREKRQAKVKDEFKRAWKGYKDKAWLHDELSPVSGKFRDPFCGWAATLVDTLDTLWIMDLQEEFEEAANALDLIDFTTSPRQDIPMFETTIRYLGGLVAAYDVSGGKYKNILDKAVELAEILIGAFDTPNRMPLLYYNWKPAFASQPHRASQRSSTAELGSLSMEFTRLAQLTKEPKYYDAVARITDALAEWQDRGSTKLPGVFPDNIDASGCNRTAPTKTQPVAAQSAIQIAQNDEDPVGFRAVAPATVVEPRPRKQKGKTTGPGTLEVEVMEGEPGKARIIGWDDEPKPGLKFAKRGMDEELATGNNSASVSTSTTNTRSTPPKDLPDAKKQISSMVGDWDCVPQGLDSAASWGADKFSMGGGQDSTYEYFPKQYILLGGLEDKYRTMYLKTIDAVRKWMIYRPMLPDNRDILFSGSVTTYDDEVPKLSADVEHLTCFIGGMVGMGAKLFGLEGDLEIAKKLTDGCVWAYEATETGIMPEGSIVMPCKSVEHCTWNQTEYMQFIDPQWATRDQGVIDYEERKAARLKEEAAEEAESQRLAAEEQALEKQKASDPTVSDFMHDQTIDEEKKSDPTVSDFMRDQSNYASQGTVPTGGSGALKKETPDTLVKRQLDSPKNDVPAPLTHDFRDELTSSSGSPSAHKEVPAPVTHDFRDELTDSKSASAQAEKPVTQLSPQEQLYANRMSSTEAELADLSKSGRPTEKPLVQHETAELPPDPMRPQNHSEYVASRIASERLPPGFVTIRSHVYILRPEAIESVWYMYRITGDSSWQDKGWRMFEAILAATATPYGHSAIHDVTATEVTQKDEMESFWLAETLKYFYLLYSTPDTISLDEWVLNTEAHPFKRPS